MLKTARPDRRAMLFAGAAAWLSACGPAKPKKAAPAEASGPAAGTLAWALQGPWRTPQDREEDQERHPAETLEFFGIKPNARVCEIWPASGWWTRILAPYLQAGGGTLYAAEFEVGPGAPTAAGAVGEAYLKMLRERRADFGDVVVTRFGPTSGAIAPAGSLDLVLFFHLDRWMSAGLAEKAFRAAHEALRPGGVLGVVQDRGPTGAPQDPLAANGLVEEAYARDLATEAGFDFSAASSVNAAAPGARGPDRMTLKFLRRA